MKRCGWLLACMALTAGGGCSIPGPAAWHEGEDFAEAHDSVSIESKPAATRGKCLTGRALHSEGDRVAYDLTLPIALPGAKLLIRHARFHWREMPASTVDVELLIPGTAQTFTGTLTIGDTGGWGKRKEEWGLASVTLGDLPAGKARLTLSSRVKGYGDVVIDGFLIVPGSIEVTREELAAADRIEITGGGYVGLDVGTDLVNQKTSNGFGLIGRHFRERTAYAQLELLDAGGKVAAQLHSGQMEMSAARVRNVRVGAGPMANLADGKYTLRARMGATVLEAPVELIGELQAGYAKRVNALAETLTAMRLGKLDASRISDFEHAVAELHAGAKLLAAGRNARELTANLHRTLDQYELAADAMKRGSKLPFAGMRGDLRLAFRSAATGKLEPYRLFLPSGYGYDYRMPVIITLNHNENNFFDQAGGVTKVIAEKRGYAMISPKATSNYWGDGQKDLVQLLDIVLKAYPGLDRGRVFCTGVSRGGFGTPALATAYPKRLAAVACVSGVGNRRAEAGRFSRLPTLILQGKLDGLVKPETSRRVAAELGKRKIPHELHVFDTHGHPYAPYAEQYFTMSLDYFEKHAPRRATGASK